MKYKESEALIMKVAWFAIKCMYFVCVSIPPQVI